MFCTTDLYSSLYLIRSTLWTLKAIKPQPWFSSLIRGLIHSLLCILPLQLLLLICLWLFPHFYLLPFWSIIVGSIGWFFFEAFSFLMRKLNSMYKHCIDYYNSSAERLWMKPQGSVRIFPVRSPRMTICTWPLFPHHTFCDFSLVCTEETGVSGHYYSPPWQQSSFLFMPNIINTILWNWWFPGSFLCIFWISIDTGWVTCWYLCLINAIQFHFLQAQSHYLNCIAYSYFDIKTNISQGNILTN